MHIQFCEYYHAYALSLPPLSALTIFPPRVLPSMRFLQNSLTLLTDSCFSILKLSSLVDNSFSSFSTLLRRHLMVIVVFLFWSSTWRKYSSFLVLIWVFQRSFPTGFFHSGFSLKDAEQHPPKSHHITSSFPQLSPPRPTRMLRQNRAHTTSPGEAKCSKECPTPA